MAKKIEILENTLLKLLVRRGSNLDRQQIVLSEGELGYTTDDKRLFVGDGSNTGGILAGNKYRGAAADHTTITNVEPGDYVVNTTEKTLYIKTDASYQAAGTVLTAMNDSIVIDSTTGTISANFALSAGKIDYRAVGNSIEIDGTGAIALSSTRIKTNSIRPNSVNYLNLPQKLEINEVEYDFPANAGLSNNTFLQTDVNGNLRWTPPTTNTTYFFNSTAGPIPVGTIMPYVSATSAPPGWLQCDGQTVNGVDYPQLSAVLGETYGTASTGVTFKLPNFLNSSLYGVAANPATSTVYSLCGATTNTGFALSANASLFIIKAIPDALVTSTLTIQDGLSAVINGVDETGTSVSPLTGNISIGIDTRTTAFKNTNAGGGGDATSSTYWFDEPRQIYNYTGTDETQSGETRSFTFYASPLLSAWNGSASSYTGETIPTKASAIILESTVVDNDPFSNADVALVYAKSSELFATKPYQVASTFGRTNYTQRSTNQVTLPLSANNAAGTLVHYPGGQLVGAFQHQSWKDQVVTIKAIGYII